VSDHDHKTCPHCGVSLCAGLIRETIRGGPYSEEQIVSMYGDGKCYGREVGHALNDAVRTWHCPDCGESWPR